MTRFFLALIRCISLLLSFFLASLIAALFITLALFLGGDAYWLQDDPTVLIASLLFTIGIWFVILQNVFLPFAGLAIIAEFTRLSSMLSNIVLGGMCALYFLIIPNVSYEYSSQLPYDERSYWLAIIAAGFVGGISHWLIAGYRAGRWLGPEPIQERADQAAD